MVPCVADPTLGFLVADVGRLIRQRFEAALSGVDCGLTAAEARTLNMVRQLPDQRQSVLAGILGIEPMTLVGHLDRLEQAGLICREADPQDRRAKIIVLGEAAQSVLAKIDEALLQVRAEISHGMTPEETAAAVRVLLQVRSNLAEAADRA